MDEPVHGAFRLKHPYDAGNSLMKTEDDLMAYSKSTRLYKFHWNECHDKDLGLNWFEEESEGESVGKPEPGFTCVNDKSVFSSSIFFDPAGHGIDIGKDIPYAFYGLNEEGNLKGALAAFKRNGILYKVYHSNNVYQYYAPSNNKADQIKPATVASAATKVLINGDVVSLQTGKNIIISSQIYTCNCEGFKTTNLSYTGRAKEVYDNLISKLSIDQKENIDKVATQIQSMADRYDDYEKLALSNNPYNTWVNTPEHLAAFNTALLNYFEAHKNSPKVDNPNCPDCPKYPIIGDAYWDEAGRNWVYWEGNKWKDLSGEFCEEEGCNNDWKQSMSADQIQLIHQNFYEEELTARETALQRSLGGTPEESKTYLRRATQFATITYLKEMWVDEQVGWEKWIPVYGNVLKAAANAKVANGDMTFYTKATVNIAFAATDVVILRGIIKSLAEQGLITLAKKGLTEELSLLKVYINNSGKLFVTGVIISGLTQIASNYAVSGDLKQSIFKTDVFDMFIDGISTTVTIGTNQFYNLFKNGTRLYIYDKISEKIAKVFILNFTKASIDYNLADNEVKSMFNGKKEDFDVLVDFVLRLGIEWSNDKITQTLVKWSEADLKNAAFFKDFSTEKRELAEKIDAIVHSDGFKEALKSEAKIIKKFVELAMKKENSLNVVIGK